MKRSYTFFLILLLLLTAVPLLMAQRVDGTLRGDVHDPSGAMVEGAQVTVTNQGTGVGQTIVSTTSGSYVFPNLLVGMYTLTVEKQGFQTYINHNIEVKSNTVSQADVRLTIGSAETTVEVTAGAEVVQTSDATLSNNLNSDQLVSLPVQAQGGGILNLAILAPNTTTQGGGVLGRGGSIGGARPRMNNFTVDGLDDNDVSVTGPITTVVSDAVAEFNLLTNQFSAEYGHSAGGQFNLVTKSGTNDFHGTGFIINNNRNYNAFDNIEKQAQGCDTDPGCDKARFDYNIIGGSFGGPLVKNKVFFFGAYQRQFAGFAGSSSVIEAPTASGLANLKALAENSAVTNILNAFPTAASSARTINVTNAGSTTTLPVDIGFLSLLAPSYQNETDWNVSGDVNLAAHQIRMRYLRNKIDSPNLSDPPIPAFSGSYVGSVHKATLSDVWTVNSHFINDFRAGYSRLIQDWTVPSQFNNFPNVYVDELSSFQVGPEGNSPQGGGQNVYQLLDQMSYSKGAHTLKWGVEYRRWIAPSGFLPRSRGEWEYADLTELVNDFVPSSFAKRGAGSGRFDGNQTAAFGFFQDDWKVSPRLTLNLGMRYEWFGIPNGARLQQLNRIASLPGTDLLFNIPKSDTNNWMPRFGFAWDPKGDGKWAVRGGFGLSYDVIPQNFPTLSLPPQLQSEQDPDITCSLSGAPSWCADYVGGSGLGQGFLAGGGLLQVNLPPTNQAEARAATQGVIVDQVMPKVYTWTLSAQHELFKNTSLELRYLGTKGTQLPVQKQVNARSAFDNGATPLPTYFSLSDVPTSFTTGAPTLADFQSFIFRPYRADGFVGSVTSFPGLGDNIYHSGSVDFIHRSGKIKGLYLRANYTWAHNLDNATNELFSSLINPRRPQDANHMEQERGRSVLDIRHKAALSWTYDLPKWGIESAFLKTLINGWQLNGTYIFQTGQPATARSVTDSNGNGDSAGDRPIFNPAGDPHLGTSSSAVCWDGVVVSFGCSTSANIVGYVADNANAGFVQAQAGSLSNVGRNTLTTPGRNNWDMALFKNTHITEQKYIQFRAEVFNVFNHRQFSFANPGVFPIAGIDDSAINAQGYVSVIDSQFLDPKQLNGGSRQIQLGLKFVF
jgi:carboxypeptidase family protein/TonB-dependent receptor-like protein